MNFKKKYSLEKRKEESNKILLKYPEKIPIIVERSKKCSLEDIDKNKYLAPQELTMAQFLYVIRKRIKLNSEEALYCFVDNALPPCSSTLGCIYHEHKDEDGFLYVKYCSENVFG